MKYKPYGNNGVGYNQQAHQQNMQKFGSDQNAWQSEYNRVQSVIQNRQKAGMDLSKQNTYLSQLNSVRPQQQQQSYKPNAPSVQKGWGKSNPTGRVNPGSAWGTGATYQPPSTKNAWGGLLRNTSASVQSKDSQFSDLHLQKQKQFETFNNNYMSRMDNSQTDAISQAYFNVGNNWHAGKSIPSGMLLQLSEQTGMNQNEILAKWDNLSSAENYMARAGYDINDYYSGSIDGYQHLTNQGELLDYFSKLGNGNVNIGEGGKIIDPKTGRIAEVQYNPFLKQEGIAPYVNIVYNNEPIPRGSEPWHANDTINVNGREVAVYNKGKAGKLSTGTTGLTEEQYNRAKQGDFGDLSYSGTTWLVAPDGSLTTAPADAESLQKLTETFGYKLANGNGQLTARQHYKYNTREGIQESLKERQQPTMQDYFRSNVFNPNSFLDQYSGSSQGDGYYDFLVSSLRNSEIGSNWYDLLDQLRRGL